MKHPGQYILIFRGTNYSPVQSGTSTGHPSVLSLMPYVMQIRTPLVYFNSKKNSTMFNYSQLKKETEIEKQWIWKGT